MTANAHSFGAISGRRCLHAVYFQEVAGHPCSTEMLDHASVNGVTIHSAEVFIPISGLVLEQYGSQAQYSKG